MKTKKVRVDKLSTPDDEESKARDILNSWWSKKGDILSYDHGRVYEQKLHVSNNHDRSLDKRKSQLRKSMFQMIRRIPSIKRNTRSFQSFQQHQSNYHHFI